MVNRPKKYNYTKRYTRDYRKRAPKQKPSRWWYLLPLFFGILGGLAGYFLVKDRDKKLAKRLIITGIIIMILHIVVSFLTYLWINRLQKRTTSSITERLNATLGGLKAEASMESIWNGTNNLSLSVKNTGGTDIVINKDNGAAYCNGKLISILDGTSLTPGDRGVVVLDCSEATVDGGDCCCPLPKNSVEIKVNTGNVEIIGRLWNKSSMDTPACSYL